jgi:dTDP-4-dehydrorhamnose reductase
MRIVITGHKGQLGTALREICREDTSFGLDLPEYDITDGQTISEAICDFAPQAVIHPAAFTDVDGCELDPDKAYAVNALGTQNVALACQACGAAMVYVSTNEVFDGTKQEPYLEFDPPNPISVYGRSKLAGEMYTRALLQKFYIVRTAWLYARGGNNFVTKIVRAADEKGQLSVVTDEVSSPTYAPDLAEAIARLIRTGHYGLYHLTNSGQCSRYEFALKILELSGLGHVPVTPITSDRYERAATPPPHAVIRNYCAATALGITLRPWEEALKEYFQYRLKKG